MYWCSTDLVLVLTCAHCQTFFIRRSRSNHAQWTESLIVGFQPAFCSLKLQSSPPTRCWIIPSWHLIIGSTRALDPRSGILTSALLPCPRPHCSDSDSGYAKPHVHLRCSRFKFELAQVRSSDVPFIGHGLTVLQVNFKVHSQHQDSQ